MATKFNFLLGQVDITQEGARTTTYNKSAIEDYIARETGLSTEIDRNNRIIKGISNPEEYLKDKNADLVKVNKSLAAMFEPEFKRLFEMGMTDEEARKKATAFIEHEKQRLMKNHNQDFPTEVGQKVVKKLLNTK